MSVNRENSGSLATNATILKVINGAADVPVLYQVALKANIEDDPEYIAQMTEYENGLLSFKVDQEELWRKIKITQEDMQQYFEANSGKYSFTDSGKVKTRDFEEVKSEISNTLQQEKFTEMEKTYVDNLRAKYPVKVNEAILIEAFKE